VNVAAARGGETSTDDGAVANQRRLWTELWFRHVPQTCAGAEKVDVSRHSER